MYIKKPEEFIIQIKSELVDKDESEIVVRDEEDNVKVDVPQSVFDGVINKTNKIINDLYKEIESISKNLSSDQVRQLHIALMRKYLLITLKRIDFLQSLKLKYATSDIKILINEVKKVYNEAFNSYSCNKDSGVVKKESDDDFYLTVLNLADVVEEKLNQIYDDAKNFSVPQTIELLQVMGKKVYDLHAKNVQCLSSLKGDTAAKNKYYNLINKYVIGALEEAKLQEEAGK